MKKWRRQVVIKELNASSAGPNAGEIVDQSEIDVQGKKRNKK